MQAKIFINYRRDDAAAAAGRIDDRLRQAFGHAAVYRDIDNIPVGTDFVDHIEDAVARARAVLVVIGDRWVSPRLFEPHDFVRLEIEAALKHQLPIIPVLIDQARMPAPVDVPPSLLPLLRRNGVQLESGRDFAVHSARLVEGLRGFVNDGDVESPGHRKALTSQLLSSRVLRVLLPVALAIALVVVGKVVQDRFAGESAASQEEPAVVAGAMPIGGNFTGVYFSPQYGEMNLIQNGNAVVGDYKQDMRSGKLQGEANGDLLRFEWIEHKAMVSNRAQETRGHGYFRYVIDPANGDNILKGEWGLGDAILGGGPWNAYKAKGRNPQLSAASDASAEDDLF